MESVTDTCTEECAFYKKYMKPGKSQCPFYIGTTWVNEENTQPKIVNDCAPKRSVIMQTETFNRMLGLQISFEEQRNKFGTNTDVIVRMAQTFNTMVQEVFMKHLQIPYEDVLQIESEENCEEQKESSGTD
jgi:hypothetical protein